MLTFKIVFTCGSLLAGILVSSHRKLLVFIILKQLFWIKVSKQYFIVL